MNKFSIDANISDACFTKAFLFIVSYFCKAEIKKSDLIFLEYLYNVRVNKNNDK